MTTVSKTRKLVGTAMLAAVSVVLMFLAFPVPLMPSFIKLDLAELPALIGAFAYGPLAGAAVCLVKNLDRHHPRLSELSSVAHGWRLSGL